MERVSRKKYNYLLMFITILLFLRPHFPGINMELSLYWPDLLLFILSVFINLRLYVKTYKVFHVKELIIYMIVFSILLLKTSIYFFSLDTYFSFFKIIYYILFYNMLYHILANISGGRFRVDRYLSRIYWFVFFVVCVQAFAPPYLYNVIVALYGDLKLRPISTGRVRVYGTFFNANWFGVFLVFYYTYLSNMKEFGRINQVKYIFTMGSLLIMFFLSASRTALIGLLISVLSLLLQEFDLKNIVRFSILILTMYIFYITSINYIPIVKSTVNRFVKLYKNLFADEFKLSVLVDSRWDPWKESFNLLKENPVLGLVTNVKGSHNSYLKFFLTFGLLGTLLFLRLFWIKGQKISSFINQTILKKHIISFSASFFIMSLSADFFFSSQVMLVFVFYLSLATSYIYFS